MNNWLKTLVGISLLSCSYNSLALSICHDSFNPKLKITKGRPSSNGFDAAKLALVDKIIESDVAHGFPGAELLVMHNGVVVRHTAYGYKKLYDMHGQKLTKPQRMQCNTEFDLASNTKMYATNYALMHLVYQNKINLESPISYYIPEYIGCDSNNHCRDKITVKQLLTHTSGYMADAKFFDPEFMANYGDGLYSQESNLTKQIILTKLPFMQEIESTPNYSDIDFMLLGILVERVTGINLAEYVQDNIYQPLGLTHTFFNPLQHGLAVRQCAATELNGNTRNGVINFPNIRTQTIQCQVHDEKAYYSMAGVSGHAGLFSTAHDMAILTQLMLDNGSMVGHQFWGESTTQLFTTPLDSNDSYALGWRLAGDKDRYKYLGNQTDSHAFGHTGWIGTVTVIDPKHQLVIILLTNKKHTPIKSGKFTGDKYDTGKYYPVIDAVYQAMID
jgi:CubicO group peptidase (beta-lactamase class C family)